MSSATLSAPSSASAPDAGRQHSQVDHLLITLDSALRTVFAEHSAARPCPQAQPGTGTSLTEAEKRHAAALMRVNHVGEVCAQALYASQALGTQDKALRAQLDHAAREENDHLAWTEQRLRELGGRTSLLNPLWYAGAFGLGLIAGRAGDKVSLGFVAETERQVSDHLHGHLQSLPAGDGASRAIVAQMRDDEARHAEDALRAGGAQLPWPLRGLMRVAAKLMTTTAHHF